MQKPRLRKWLAQKLPVKQLQQLGKELTFTKYLVSYRLYTYPLSSPKYPLGKNSLHFTDEETQGHRRFNSRPVSKILTLGYRLVSLVFVFFLFFRNLSFIQKYLHSMFHVLWKFLKKLIRVHILWKYFEEVGHVWFFKRI